MSDAVIALGSQDQLVARLAANRLLGRADERAAIVKRLRQALKARYTTSDWAKLIGELEAEQKHLDEVIQQIKEKL